MVLYVAVAAVTIGTLSLEEIDKARDYALAEAAMPFFGKTGFTLIAIAALLSTASAINATLYGAARLSYIIAKEGELPMELERKIWQQPMEGLLITTGATLLIANLFDLNSIATIGSAGFLIIFAVVYAANLICAKQTGSRRWLAILGLLACLGALIALLVYTAENDLKHLVTLPLMLLLAVTVETAYQTYRAYKGRSSDSENETSQ